MVTGMANDAQKTLFYPFARRPMTGEALEILPGIMWLRMPLPFRLDHINLWAIRDGEGWAIVDSGLNTPATVAAWDTLFRGVLADGVTRVLVTHMHRDHAGMAGWLTEKFACPLWMSRLEYLSCVASLRSADSVPGGSEVDFYHRAGWSDAALLQYAARLGTMSESMHALAGSFRRLCDGETFAIGAHQWQVIVGNGHSPEHACLYCSELGVLVSGDQVLPRISSNISVFPVEPDADPVQDWLDSIQRIRQAVPDDVLVLPAHNEPFRGLHERLLQLQDGQQRGLARLRLALAKPCRAIDVFDALFQRPIDLNDNPLLGMATGESIAHLNHLIRRGEVVSTLDTSGVAWYGLRV